MPNDRPPAADANAPMPWEALERLAAHELPEDEAAALRAQIESDPAWREAYARVVSVQEELEALPLAPLPLGLVRGAMAQVLADQAPTASRWRWPQIAAGWAAAILICVTTWYAVAGTTPGLGATPDTWVAQAAPPEWLSMAENEVTTWRPALPVAAADAPSSDAWVWVVAGVLLLGFGLGNAIRMHRTDAQRGVA